MKINIQKQIAMLRKRNNMTQAELAEKLSISYQAVSQWENGNTFPDITMLPEIAKIFNVSIDPEWVMGTVRFNILYFYF